MRSSRSTWVLASVLVLGSGSVARAQTAGAPTGTATPAAGAPAEGSQPPPDAAQPTPPATTSVPVVEEEAEPAEEGKRTALNSIFFEGLGSGLWYSLNYERMVIDELAVRIGFSFIRFSATAGTSSASSTVIAIPMSVSYLGLRTDRGHGLELGGGASLYYASASSSGGGISASGSGMTAYGMVIAGYRLQPPDGGFQFRLGFTGVMGKGLGFDVNDPDKFGFLPWGHISFGGTF